MESMSIAFRCFPYRVCHSINHIRCFTGVCFLKHRNHCRPESKIVSLAVLLAMVHKGETYQCGSQGCGLVYSVGNLRNHEANCVGTRKKVRSRGNGKKVPEASRAFLSQTAEGFGRKPFIIQCNCTSRCSRISGAFLCSWRWCRSEGGLQAEADGRPAREAIAGAKARSRRENRRGKGDGKYGKDGKEFLQSHLRAVRNEPEFREGQRSNEERVDGDPAWIPVRDLPGREEIWSLRSLWAHLRVQTMLWSPGASQQGQFCDVPYLSQRRSIYTASLSLIWSHYVRLMRWEPAKKIAISSSPNSTLGDIGRSWVFWALWTCCGWASVRNRSDLEDLCKRRFFFRQAICWAPLGTKPVAAQMDTWFVGWRLVQLLRRVEDLLSISCCRCLLFLSLRSWLS